ncbi:hypothetical protein ACEWPL_002305 [Roseovarius sp. S1116L3]|uniref:hypothetical protein n=1 Tax=Roseovarius roseus TaxID=3342636 RepID=UPI00372C79C1
MFAKLFKKPEPTEKVFRRTFEPRHLTRFTNNHTRFDYPDMTSEPGTQSPEVAQSRPVETIAPAAAAAIVSNPLDHLHSDAPIPVDLLRRTLPERFREMDATTADRSMAGSSACATPPISSWSHGINDETSRPWA